MVTSASVVREPSDLTPEWLGEILGTDVGELDVERIGTGQMSQNYRATWGEGESVVLKLAAQDPGSRATGVGLGAYQREIRFYREVAPRIGEPLAACHAALYEEDEGWFTLVLEDVAPAHQGDQIAGCSVEEARLAMRELARIHAPVLGDPALAASDWLNQPSPLNQALLAQLLPGFLERYDDRVAPEHRELCERMTESLDGWSADRRPPLGLAHGDYRIDNMLFGEEGAQRPLTVVDWQTVSYGPAMMDASYFLGAGLTVEDRREHEEELLREYHSALKELGAPRFAWGECWEGYRHQAFHGVVMAVAASMLVERTDRGDDMFMTSLARHAQQAIDLDSVALLPDPGTGRPPALRPDPEDEGRHPAGPEQFWNESWYFDAVAEDGSVGAYVRMGLTPNLGGLFYTAFVCGPDRPTVAAVEFETELPEGDVLDSARGSMGCAAPLERFEVSYDGPAASYEDPAGLLRQEEGEPTELSLDLTWETAGQPYAYRLATRYEIPCRVSGTIRVGDEELELRGVGQRDHSWGTRDWWAMDWVWSAGHLDDGTRFHAVELRIPDLPRMSVGYIQPPDGDLIELDEVRATEEVRDDGLIDSAALTLAPGDLQLEVEPLAFGPLRLEAPDGRVSSFPRAMCRVRAADGREGFAWLEWNRNQPS